MNRPALRERLSRLSSLSRRRAQSHDLTRSLHSPPRTSQFSPRFLASAQTALPPLAAAVFPRDARQQKLQTRALSTPSDGVSATPATGFSYPGPRKLSEIVKLQLLNKHGTPRVREIWLEYHKDHKSAVGDVLTDEEYGLLMQRTQRCRHFVLPVPREGGYFTLLVQFQGKQCFMTYLEDYKQNAAGAQPYLTLSLFDELLESKGVALVRGEVTNMLTRQEAKILLELIKEFYLGARKNFDAVVTFNENSAQFDFKSVLRVAGIA